MTKNGKIILIGTGLGAVLLAWLYMKKDKTSSKTDNQNTSVKPVNNIPIKLVDDLPILQAPHIISPGIINTPANGSIGTIPVLPGQNMATASNNYTTIVGGGNQMPTTAIPDHPVNPADLPVVVPNTGMAPTQSTVPTTFQMDPTVLYSLPPNYAILPGTVSMPGTNMVYNPVKVDLDWGAISPYYNTGIINPVFLPQNQVVEEF